MPLAALVLELDARDAERLSEALLFAGALSVDLEDARQGTPQERASFDEPGEERNWTQVKLTALFQADSDPIQCFWTACEAWGLGRRPYAMRQVDDLDWVRRSQSQFQPIRVSDRLWIVPSWHAPPDPGAINLVLDPGTAFGTGSHATTRLCLLWLESNVTSDVSLVDYGSGSGILAIAAMKMGARRALGVDIDPDALLVARRNAERNGVSAAFVDAHAPADLSGDLVVANILANPLKMLAPVLARICKPGGRLALSGILAPQEAEIREAYHPWFALEQSAEDDGWLCLWGPRR
jgi:ribosomal protein L11 methyltransferase